jgi:hypothetical protein
LTELALCIIIIIIIIKLPDQARPVQNLLCLDGFCALMDVTDTILWTLSTLHHVDAHSTPVARTASCYAMLCYGLMGNMMMMMMMHCQLHAVSATQHPCPAGCSAVHELWTESTHLLDHPGLKLVDINRTPVLL